MKSKSEKAKVGRPVQAVPKDLADDVIEWISAGKTLREWCRIDGNPAFRTVYDWIEKDAEFHARFARAREVGQDVIAEECIAIIDEDPELVVTEGGTHRDSAHIAWLKNRAEMRLKLLAKWNPKRYGDRQNIELSGKLSLEALVSGEDG